MDKELTAIFNKTSEAFIGFSFSPEVLNNPNILTRQVSVSEHANMAMYKWVGGYQDGYLINRADAPEEVTEEILWEKFKTRFYRKYSMEDLMLIMVQHMAKFRHFEEMDVKHYTPDMIEMLDFFEKMIERNAKEVEHFRLSENHIYLQKGQAERDLEERFA